MSQTEKILDDYFYHETCFTYANHLFRKIVKET